MTAVQTGPEDTEADQSGRPAGSVAAAARARQRRQKRETRIGGQRLTRTGRPMRAALTRLPFVLLIIGLLGGAIVGVLWLTTMSDEVGLKASASRGAQSSLQIQIEAGNRDVASLGALPRIDAAAQAMGMVPAGDAPIMVVGSNGAVSVIGTPSPVTAPTTAPPSTPAPSTPAPSTPAPSTPAPTSPAPSTPAPSTPAAVISAAVSPQPSAVATKTVTTSGKATVPAPNAGGAAPSATQPSASQGLASKASTSKAPVATASPAPGSAPNATATTTPTSAKVSR